MAISHADHNHPNTPAARASCRKQMANGDTPLTGNPVPAGGVAGTPHRKHTKASDPCPAAKPAKLTVVPRKAMAKTGTPVEAAVLVGKSQGGPKIVVVPRRRGDGGVVRGMIAAKPSRKEKQINNSGDLPADIPTNHALTIARAWERGWPVILGERLKDDETRILIGGNLAQVALVWNVEGRGGVFVRSITSSITRRVDSGPQALALASGEEEWPWMIAGKPV